MEELEHAQSYGLEGYPQLCAVVEKGVELGLRSSGRTGQNDQVVLNEAFDFRGQERGDAVC